MTGYAEYMDKKVDPESMVIDHVDAKGWGSSFVEFTDLETDTAVSVWGDGEVLIEFRNSDEDTSYCEPPIIFQCDDIDVWDLIAVVAGENVRRIRKENNLG